MATILFTVNFRGCINSLILASTSRSLKVKNANFYMPYIDQYINPFTPKSYRSNNSPVASPEILHNTVWRICLFIACSDERWLCYQFSLSHAYICLWEGREKALFELRSERVKWYRPYNIRRTSSFTIVSTRTTAGLTAEYPATRKLLPRETDYAATQSLRQPLPLKYEAVSSGYAVRTTPPPPLLRFVAPVAPNATNEVKLKT